jgi:hypothetical protein
MGLNTSEPDQIYHRLFDFNKLYDRALDYSQPTFYHQSPERIGKRMRKVRASLPRGDIIPWMDPGSVEEFPSEWIYDRVLEVFGSGALGIAWFAYNNFEGADFYYVAKAMEAVIPVEEVIVGSEPMAPIEVMSGAVNATGIANGPHHLLLLSDYRSPPEQRMVELRLPNDVEGTLWDLARKQQLGEVSGRNLSLEWRPGVDGARTALYYLGPAPLEHDRFAVESSPAARTPH